MEKALNLMTEDILLLTNESLEEGYSLEECFPAFTSKRVEIDGVEYFATMEITLKRPMGK